MRHVGLLQLYTELKDAKHNVYAVVPAQWCNIPADAIEMPTPVVDPPDSAKRKHACMKEISARASALKTPNKVVDVMLFEENNLHAHKVTEGDMKRVRRHLTYEQRKRDLDEIAKKAVQDLRRPYKPWQATCALGNWLQRRLRPTATDAKQPNELHGDAQTMQVLLAQCTRFE